MAKKNQNKQTHKLTRFEFVKTKARTFPIYKCYINSEWFDVGFAYIIIVRLKPGGNFLAGFYSIDTFIKGVCKTRALSNTNQEEINEFLKLMAPKKDDESIIVEIDYALAHNIIFGAIAYAKTKSFEPDYEFSCTKYILEEDDDKIEKIEIDFENNIMFREYESEIERQKNIDLTSKE